MYTLPESSRRRLEMQVVHAGHSCPPCIGICEKVPHVAAYLHATRFRKQISLQC